MVPQGVVTGRVDADGEELPAALLTEHLRFSLPYRSLFSHGLTAENLPSLIDALVVLLVRLHLAGLLLGRRVPLQRAVPAQRRRLRGVPRRRRDRRAAATACRRQMREYDVTVGCENVFAELLDLQASEALDATRSRPTRSWSCSHERYDALWDELTGEEEFAADEMWRIEQRIERLNDLGFDVDELDIVTDFDGDRVRIQPKVVELGHHQRELQALTGMHVEDAQARRLLNDIAAYTAHYDLGREDRAAGGQPLADRDLRADHGDGPAEARGKLEPAEIFHEILVHRWYLSERAGHEVDIFETARDYIDTS